MKVRFPAARTKAQEAVGYALQRVVNDPDFRWHMMGTQLLTLLLAAEAERRGVAVDVVRRELDNAIAMKSQRQPPAQLWTLRQKVMELEDRVYELSQGRASRRKRRKKRELSPLEWLEQTWEPRLAQD